MSEALDAVVSTLEGLASPPDTEALIAAISRIYGLDHVSYFAPTTGNPPPVLHTSSISWASNEAFLTPDATHSFATACGFRFVPFEWSELPDRATRMNVSGFTVPLATPDGVGAVFSVADHCAASMWAERMKTARPEILRLAEFVHRQAMMDAGLAQEPATLAPLELRALTAMAGVPDPSRIASELGLAEATFRMVADSARHKLGALTTAHALSIAMNRGLI